MEQSNAQARLFHICIINATWLLTNRIAQNQIIHIVNDIQGMGPFCVPRIDLYHLCYLCAG